MFKKVLIANRGEIAVRIAQSIQQQGMVAAALYADADFGAVHVRSADEAYHLHGAALSETYLNGQAIIELAKKHGVEAIHPGYGFLSENAAFAELCAAEDITFIGPSPEVIRSMGDKIIAKQTMADAGVPVVPGWSSSGELDLEELASEVQRIGFPVLIKAAAGGGGKGMRRVNSAEELIDAAQAAQREAGSAFGDARVFVEKYVTGPRHVEFQIFGDTHGNYVHLFERECSIQRRYQKIIEESPSPALNDSLRAEMGAAAVRAAEALKYTNAGTVEFILDADGSFYFLEVNTRLQVEHPVTELVTGEDLVQAQLRIAAGEALPFSQESLKQVGSAVECRIYAEDSATYLPSTGTIAFMRAPIGPNIRVDSGVATGSEITVHYDPMIAKLLTWGADRNTAIERMRWALDNFVVLGVKTNIALLKKILVHPDFVAGNIDTHFLVDNNMHVESPPPDDATYIAAALASGSGGAQYAASDTHVDQSPWISSSGWRNA